MIIHSQYFWRTYLGYVAMVLLGSVVLTAWLAGRLMDDLSQEQEARLLESAQVAAQAAIRPLQTLNYPELSAFAERFREVSDYRLTLIDANGLVVADTHERPLDMGNHQRRPEVIDAIGRGEGRAVRFSQTLQDEFLYFAVPVQSESQRLGVARTAIATARLQQARLGKLNQVLQACALVLFAGLLLAFYLAARQARALEDITRVAGVIADGDFERRLPVRNGLGLRQLASVINQLARNSAERVTRITADRNRLAAIFDGMVEGVIDVDQNLRIQHINGAAARLLGVSEKNVLNKPVWQEVRSREINQALEQAIASKSVVKTQLRLSRKADEMVVDIHAASLVDDGGKPIGAVLVLHDITSLKNLERVRTDFVANASHELKTPITAIRGLSETVIGDPDVDRETLQRFMERVHAQSLRLSQLVSDLMTISRLEASEDQGDFVPVSLNDLVKRAVQAAEANSEAKGQHLSLDLPSERLQVRGESQSLNQLVDNLIDNAVKYTPDGGRIKVSLNREGDQVLFAVQDNGIGIGPQYLERIFERFYRVDKARSQSLGGTGLGLSIVKNIAEKHGGEVRVESHLGRGSRFEFRMPLA